MDILSTRCLQHIQAKMSNKVLKQWKQQEQDVEAGEGMKYWNLEFVAEDKISKKVDACQVLNGF